MRTLGLNSFSNYRIIPIYLLLCFLTFNTCAKKGFPPGGPADTTAPEVKETFPANGTTQIGLSPEIKITFGEKMQKKFTEEAVLFFPPESLKFKWDKNSLIIRPKNPLKTNKTYFVTVGTKAVDVHNNKLKSSFSFAFSTGEFLDSGFISGKIFYNGKPEAGVSVWAYLLSSSQDSILGKEIPDYVVQSQDDGNYSLPYLSSGNYRLVAIKDLNLDLKWDPAKEPLGLTFSDVKIEDANKTAENLDFNLTLRDTTHFNLKECVALDNQKLKLAFDKNLDKNSASKLDNFQLGLISDTIKVKISNSYFLYGDNKNLYLVLGEKLQVAEYKIQLLNLRDEEQDVLQESLGTCQFSGIAKQDTLRPKILTSVPNKNQINLALDSEIEIFFSEAMNQKSVENNFNLQDSMGNVVKGNYGWEDPTHFRFQPEKPWAGKMSYQIQLNVREVVDLNGNSLLDSMWNVHFTTVNPDTFGSVAIEVRSKEKFLGNIWVNLTSLDKRQTYKKILENSGKFLWETLLPGKYFLDGFVDLDENQKYSFGKISPFEPAEPLAVYPDTVRIRSRWETAGIVLEFK